MDQVIAIDVKLLAVIVLIACMVSGIVSAVYVTKYWKRKLRALKEEHKEEMLEKNYRIRDLLRGEEEQLGLTGMVMPSKDSPSHPNHPKYGLNGKLIRRA